ncbi:MAG: hypothetical protein AB7N76_25520 [Planctomycetota bacterium]
MRTPHLHRGPLLPWAALLSSLLLLGAAPAAHAQADPAHPDIDAPGAGTFSYLPEERWAKLGAADAGKRYYVVGRWLQVYGDGILLYKSPFDTRNFLKLTSAPILKDQLTKGMTGDRVGLEKKRSVVAVCGVVDGRALDVKWVAALPSDHDQFEQRLNALGKDADKIADLARECAAQAGRYEDQDLRGLVMLIIRRELEVRQAALDPKDHAGRMALAARWRAELNDAAAAIDQYSLVREAEDAPAELHEKALEQLRALSAVRVRTDQKNWRWVTYDDFKRSEGFIRRQQGGKDGPVVWIRREQAELFDAIAGELERQKGQLDPPRTDPVNCAKAARSGKVRRGQTFAEVHKAAGFPAQVYHLKRPLQDNPDAVWTQWILPDGSRVYFVNGWVISRQNRGDPWPAK